MALPPKNKALTQDEFESMIDDRIDALKHDHNPTVRMSFDSLVYQSDTLMTYEADLRKKYLEVGWGSFIMVKYGGNYRERASFVVTLQVV